METSLLARVLVQNKETEQLTPICEYFPIKSAIIKPKLIDVKTLPVSSDLERTRLLEIDHLDNSIDLVIECLNKALSNGVDLDDLKEVYAEHSILFTTVRSLSKTIQYMYLHQIGISPYMRYLLLFLSRSPASGLDEVKRVLNGSLVSPPLWKDYTETSEDMLEFLDCNRLGSKWPIFVNKASLWTVLRKCMSLGDFKDDRNANLSVTQTPYKRTTTTDVAQAISHLNVLVEYKPEVQLTEVEQIKRKEEKVNKRYHQEIGKGNTRPISNRSMNYSDTVIPITNPKTPILTATMEGGLAMYKSLDGDGAEFVYTFKVPHITVCEESGMFHMGEPAFNLWDSDRIIRFYMHCEMPRKCTITGKRPVDGDCEILIKRMDVTSTIKANVGGGVGPIMPPNKIKRCCPENKQQLPAFEPFFSDDECVADDDEKPDVSSIQDDCIPPLKKQKTHQL